MHYAVAKILKFSELVFVQVQVYVIGNLKFYVRYNTTAIKVICNMW